MIGALRELGALIDGDRLPFAVHGHGRLTGGDVTIDASSSSQFVSALLLSAARYERGVTVRHVGPAGSVAAAHRDDHRDAARSRAVDSVDGRRIDTWKVAPGADPRHRLGHRTGPFERDAVPGRRSGHRRSRHRPLWPSQTTQAGDAIRGILADVGADVSLTPDGLTVTGPRSCAGIDTDLHDVGELTPTVAALAALADAPTTLRGIAHLRGHETDRLAALCTEINALGGDCHETDGRPADHSRATARRSLAHLLRPPNGHRRSNSRTPSRRHRGRGRRAPPAKTLPGFENLWATMLVELAAPTDGPLLKTREYDESDVRVRPGQDSRPRTKIRPEHLTAPSPRWSCRSIAAAGVACWAVTPSRHIVTMRARELGPHAHRGRRQRRRRR